MNVETFEYPFEVMIIGGYPSHSFYIKTRNYIKYMRFKAKLRRIGNSQGVYIPLEVISNYILGDILELEVITTEEKEKEVITVDSVSNLQNKMAFAGNPNINKIYGGSSKSWGMCKKHSGSSKFTCGCD